MFEEGQEGKIAVDLFILKDLWSFEKRTIDIDYGIFKLFWFLFANSFNILLFFFIHSNSDVNHTEKTFSISQHRHVIDSVEISWKRKLPSTRLEWVIKWIFNIIKTRSPSHLHILITPKFLNCYLIIENQLKVVEARQSVMEHLRLLLESPPWTWTWRWI